MIVFSLSVGIDSKHYRSLKLQYLQVSLLDRFTEFVANVLVGDSLIKPTSAL